MRHCTFAASLSTIKQGLAKAIGASEPIRGRARRLYYHPKYQRVQGYHVGVVCCAAVSGVVFIINLTLTIWSYKYYGVQHGLGTIRDGSCSQTKSLATRLHLAINILSTLLLGASNYSMQCLSAPTRQDIGNAHNKRVWLDIGTPSVRNLLRISRPRMMLWLLIAMSSLPLHLLYNSAVFTTLYTREYNAFLVSADFLDGAPYDIETAIRGNGLASSANDIANLITKAGTCFHSPDFV